MPIEDFRVKIPKTLPSYTEDDEVDKVRSAIESKVTHKDSITRDVLLFDLALNTGMRRAELASLKPRDIHSDFLIAHGKGGKDRVIPLLPNIALRLKNFTKGMKPDDIVFGMKAVSIGSKIRRFSKKAGITTFHTHSMRHKFATELIERGADIRSVQEILGHSDLSSTQVYLSITSKRIRDTVSLLDKPKGVEILPIVNLIPPGLLPTYEHYQAMRKVKPKEN